MEFDKSWWSLESEQNRKTILEANKIQRGTHFMLKTQQSGSHEFLQRFRHATNLFSFQEDSKTDFKQKRKQTKLLYHLVDPAFTKSPIKITHVLDKL